MSSEERLTACVHRMVNVTPCAICYPSQMTDDERDQARGYAIACGYSNVEEMSDERLRRMMQSIADECEKYGCD